MLETSTTSGIRLFLPGNRIVLTRHYLLYIATDKKNQDFYADEACLKASVVPECFYRGHGSKMEENRISAQNRCGNDIFIVGSFEFDPG